MLRTCFLGFAFVLPEARLSSRSLLLPFAWLRFVFPADFFGKFSPPFVLSRGVLLTQARVALHAVLALLAALTSFWLQALAFCSAFFQTAFWAGELNHRCLFFLAKWTRALRRFSCFFGL